MSTEIPAKRRSATKTPQIMVIGCRNVAPASIYSLLGGATRVDVRLFGDGSVELCQAVLELKKDLPTRFDSSLAVCDTDEVPKADIVILSSGSPPFAGETEDEYILRTIDRVRADADLLGRNDFKGLLIVTTNPVEITAMAAMEKLGLPSDKVIGLGPAAAANMHSVLSIPLATWCSVAECVSEFIDSCRPECPYFEEMLGRYNQYSRQERTGSRTMASCVMRVCEAVLSDEKAVLPVAAILHGEYGITGAFVTVPCVIGRNGVEKVVELPRSDPERLELLDLARDHGRTYYRLARQKAAMSNSASA